MTEQMTCQEYRSHLDEWLDGTLSDDLAEAMRKHREACAECAEETRLAEETLSLIHSLEPEEPVPLQVQAAWRSAVRKEARQRTRLHWSAGFKTLSTVAASFLVLAGCTIGFRNAGLLDMPAAREEAVYEASAADTAAYYADSGVTAAASMDVPVRYTYIASDSAVTRSAAAQPDEAASEEAAVMEDVPMLAAEAPDMDAEIGTPIAYASEPMLIRSVSRTISAVNYDSDAQCVRDLTEQYGGYLAAEKTSMLENGIRRCEFSCVLPEIEVDNFLQALDHVGVLTGSAEYYTDVSSDVRDVTAKLDALEAEKDRIMELIDTASADELQTLNQQLQAVFLEIDALQTRSHRLNDDLHHVCVSVVLEEQPTAFTPEPTIAPELVDRMSSAFSSSAESLQNFMRDMLVSLMVIAPFLIAFGACAAAIILLVRILHRRK